MIDKIVDVALGVIPYVVALGAVLVRFGNRISGCEKDIQALKHATTCSHAEYKEVSCKLDTLLVKMSAVEEFLRVKEGRQQ